MKKIILIGCMALCTMYGFGQKMEVSVGYGTPSLYGVGDSFINILGSALLKTDMNTDSNGALHLEVTRYNVSERWRYGVETNIEFFSTSGKLLSNHHYGISPKVDYFYSSAERKLRFYSGLSLGVVIRNIKYEDTDYIRRSSSDAIVAFNLTPIGVKYGGPFGVYLETNIGSRSFLQLGMYYQF